MLPLFSSNQEIFKAPFLGKSVNGIGVTYFSERPMEIAYSLRHLQSCHKHWAEGLTEPATADVMMAIKLLVVALRNDTAKQHQQDAEKLSRYALDIHQKLKRGVLMSMDDRIAWLGSSLNGGYFPPLIEGIVAVEKDEELPDQLTLSSQQQELLKEWVHIDQQDWSTTGIEDINQDYLQDCSFVVALISLARKNPNLLLSNISPHAHSQRFGVTLQFNGCPRLVEVGNQLPLLREKSLFIRSQTNKALYWPALLEKAYLKVLGHGYDSHGSNAGIDTYLISGWVPEYIISSHERPDFNVLWHYLFDNFNSNQCVLAVGTGVVAGDGYIPNHDYAIVDLLEEDERVMVVKNPWNGNTSVVHFVEMFDVFETMCVNWNMMGWNKQSKNFIWSKKSLEKRFDTFLHLPQFHIHNRGTEENEFWVMLERHIGFGRSNNNLAIYETFNGEKVWAPCKPLVMTLGNDTGFLLSKFKLARSKSATIVVLNDSDTLQNFTLHAYSQAHTFTLSKSGLLFPFFKEINDKWDVDACGGNWSNQTYIKNPQYDLVIPDHPTDVYVKLGLFSKKNILINMQLFWESEANKPFDQSQTSLINEKYRTGKIICQLRLKPGQRYKLVLSTYDTDIIEDYKLVVSSDLDSVQIQKLSTLLGLYSKSFKFSWNGKNRFKLNFTVAHQTNLSIHLWTNQGSYSNYRPQIRASLFYKGGEAIRVNPEFDDNLYGIWLLGVNVKPGTEIILLVERFEIGNDEVIGEIGSDFKIEMK